MDTLGKVPASIAEASKSVPAVAGDKKHDIQDQLALPAELEMLGTNVEHYDLSKYDNKNANVDRLRKLPPKRVIAGVDGTRFKKIERAPEWYKDYIESAKEISACYDLLDESTKKWFDSLKGPIGKFAGMTAFDQKVWDQMKKDFKSEDIFGSKGLFNFLLAWQRATNICPKLENSKNKDFKIDELNIESISLVLGVKVDDRESRFAGVVPQVENKRPKPPKPKTKPKKKKRPAPPPPHEDKIIDPPKGKKDDTPPPPKPKPELKRGKGVIVPPPPKPKPELKRGKGVIVPPPPKPKPELKRGKGVIVPPPPKPKPEPVPPPETKRYTVKFEAKPVTVPAPPEEQKKSEPKNPEPPESKSEPESGSLVDRMLAHKPKVNSAPPAGLKAVGWVNQSQTNASTGNMVDQFRALAEANPELGITIDGLSVPRSTEEKTPAEPKTIGDIEIPDGELKFNSPEYMKLKNQLEKLPKREGPLGDFKHLVGFRYKDNVKKDTFRVFYASSKTSGSNEKNPSKPFCFAKVDYYKKVGNIFKFSHSIYGRTPIAFYPPSKNKNSFDARAFVQKDGFDLDPTSKLFGSFW